MKYYKVSNSGFESKVIVAYSEYEALGFYLMEINDQLGFVDDIDVEEVDPDERVEISYTGYPVYKTLKEIYQENDFWEIPNVVVEVE
ncbi:hypothetical protein QUF81_21720 [Peribacillus simplex]|uniref:Uncharacterized protein n=1 Tax=Peribacillus simplex TaxID=1478 RepID=A0AAW7IK40_9BACI|nr:hypothetical protein [Peribacillus simplex]AMM92213.1 hypothetical protein UP17_06400 [Peribacillus simplex]MDM5295733.1 hypothetical protein [Peribacillus simplex]MDM5454739.1 hypothetical protein [Peribacillus simplex]RRN72450.1 hypothetical protein EI200_07665 [Peribacillus simplex]